MSDNDVEGNSENCTAVDRASGTELVVAWNNDEAFADAESHSESSMEIDWDESVSVRLASGKVVTVACNKDDRFVDLQAKLQAQESTEPGTSYRILKDIDVMDYADEVLPYGDTFQAIIVSDEKVLREFAKSIGVDEDFDEDLMWLAKEAMMARLPVGWVEAVDVEGRVYFCDEVGNSSWSHPLDDTFRVLFAIVKDLRAERATEKQCQAAIDSHMTLAYESAVESMQHWSGPYDTPEGRQYFYDSVSGASTWNNPMKRWEEDLALRYRVLSRCLFAGASDFEQEQEGIFTLQVSSWSSPRLKVKSPRFGEGTPRSPSAHSFATVASSTQTASSQQSSRRIARSTSRSPGCSPPPSPQISRAESPAPSSPPSFRQIAGSPSRSPCHSQVVSPDRSSAWSPESSTARELGDIDLESAIVLKIRAFAADATAKVLELPSSLSAAQRRKAKALVEEHPEVKCESFGFGADRRLHLFRQTCERQASGTGLKKKDGGGSECDSLEFTFGSAALAGIPNQIASVSKSGYAKNIPSAQIECNQTFSAQKSGLEKSSDSDTYSQDNICSKNASETSDQCRKELDVAIQPTVTRLQSETASSDEPFQRALGVDSGLLVITQDNANSSNIFNVIREPLQQTSHSHALEIGGDVAIGQLQDKYDHSVGSGSTIVDPHNLSPGPLPTSSSDIELVQEGYDDISHDVAAHSVEATLEERRLQIDVLQKTIETRKFATVATQTEAGLEELVRELQALAKVGEASEKSEAHS